MENIKTERKAVKKDTRCVGTSLLIYQLISVLVVLFAPLLTHLLGFGDSLAMDIATIATPLLGLGFMLLFFRKKNVIRKSFHTERKMTRSHFLILLCAFLLLGMLASAINDDLETRFNADGMTMYPAALLEALSGNSVAMLLAAWVLAPIGEELIFRGLLLRHLEKYGKVPAILITALLFGAFHMNLPQAINAFLLGLLLGYVAMEYSIGWSILLHAIQNLVIGSLLPTVATVMSLNLATLLVLCAFIVCLVVTVDAITRNWSKISQWFRDNKGKRSTMGWIMTSASMLCLIALCVVVCDMFIVAM